MSETLLSSFIEELAKDLELAETPLADNAGAYSFPFGKTLIVGISTLQGVLGTNGTQNSSRFGAINSATDRPIFYFSAFLGPCPKENCEDFFSKAMLANLFGKGTGGAVIGLNEEGNTLTLTKKVTDQLNYAAFKLMIEDFVNYVDLWQKKVSDAAAVA